MELRYLYLLPYPMNRSLGAPHRLFGTFGVQINFWSPSEFEFRIVQLVATILYRLCYPCSLKDGCFLSSYYEDSAEYSHFSILKCVKCLQTTWWNWNKEPKIFLGFSYRAFFKYYDKGYQQMPLSFVIFLYLYVSSLHVSGLYQPIIRGIPSCCLFVTTWFM